MSQGLCSPESQAACPLMQCRGTDLHHLQFPANSYLGHVEKRWRNQDFNKIDIERCVHQAIHASGYQAGRPTRDEMALEIFEGGSERADLEAARQLAIGRKCLEGERPLQ